MRSFIFIVFAWLFLLLCISEAQDIDSLVGWWSLAEFDTTDVDTTMGDLSGNANVGTIFGTNGYTTDPWGRANAAMSFDGNGDYVRCGDLEHDGKAEYSMSAWVNYDSTDVYFQYIVGINDSVGGGPPAGRYVFIIGYDNNINGPKAYVAGATTYWLQNMGPGGVTDTWQHITMTWSQASDSLNLYRNGVLIGSNTAGAGALRTDDGIFIIGSDHADPGAVPGGRDFTGSLCQIRVYGKRLTQTEVTALYEYDPTNFYVSDQGNDSNNGNTLTTPLLTVSAALVLAINPGDSVSLFSGDKFRETGTIGASGTDGNPITISVVDSTTGLTGADALALGDSAIISGADIITGLVNTETWGERTGSDSTGVTEDMMVMAGGEVNVNKDANNDVSTQDYDGAIEWSAKGFIRFDLSSGGSLTPTSATLKIYNYKTDSPTIDIHVVDDAWVENKATWNCAQDDDFDGACDIEWSASHGEGTLLFDNYSISDTGYYDFSNDTLLTEILSVYGSSDLDISLRADDGGWFGSYSSEHASATLRPQLEIGFGDIYWKTGIVTEPLTAGYNGVTLTENDGNYATLGANEWDWDNDILYINVGEDPDTGILEAGQRNYGIYLDGKDYIIIDGITFTYPNKSAVGLNNDADNNIVRFITAIKGCMDSEGRGILIHDSSKNLVEFNTISGFYNGIYIGDWTDVATTDSNIISENYISNSGQAGINLTLFKGVTNNIIEKNIITTSAQLIDDNAGIWTTNIGAGNIFRYNILSNGGTATARCSGIMIDDSSEAAMVHHNIIFGNEDGGIKISGTGRAGHVDLIYNNTMWGNMSEPRSSGEIHLFKAASGAIIKNNIVYGNTGELVVRLDSACSATFDNNLYYPDAATSFMWNGVASNDFADWKDSTNQDANSFIADPLFTNAASGDFTLLPDSPAIDAGVDWGQTGDFDNNPKFGSAWDIGAYESQVSISALGKQYLRRAQYKRWITR